MRTEATDALERVRAACLALPGTSERPSHGVPAFFAGARMFATFHDDHHGDGRLAIWCAADPDLQRALVEAEPERFFVPPYVGHRGWLGIRLDRVPDFADVAALIADAHALVAPAGTARRPRARS
jgi:hypothetical protein